MSGSPTGRAMMRAISPHHMTRRMLITSQAVNAWTSTTFLEMKEMTFGNIEG